MYVPVQVDKPPCHDTPYKQLQQALSAHLKDVAQFHLLATQSTRDKDMLHCSSHDDLILKTHTPKKPLAAMRSLAIAAQ